MDREREDEKIEKKKKSLLRVVFHRVLMAEARDVGREGEKRSKLLALDFYLFY